LFGITGLSLPPPDQRAAIIKGASQSELVNPAFEDTTADACHDIQKIDLQNGYTGTLHAHAFVKAINQIGPSCLNIDIFP
jgi:hypothetical protein